MFILVRYAELPTTSDGNYKFDHSRVIPLDGRDPNELLKVGCEFMEELWEYGLNHRFAGMTVSTCSEFKYGGNSVHCNPNEVSDIELNPQDVKIYTSRIAGENIEKGVRGCVTTDMTVNPPVSHVFKLTEGGPSTPQSVE